MNRYGNVVDSNSERFSPHFGPIVNSNFTMFFRYDLNRINQNIGSETSSWDNFINIIDEKFTQTDKVNVYEFGCSDGSETYSLILGLIDKLGDKNADKFFPINAFDIDYDILQIAKSGRISCLDDDIYRFSKNLKNKRTSSLYSFSENLSGSNCYFLPSEELKQKAAFQQGDFVEKIFDIEASNSLVICRNFWKYLPEEAIPYILEELCAQVDESSLLVFGALDIPLVSDLLKKQGFEEINSFVYKKTSK